MEKIIIIGSGPAGLTAAIYAARANLAPLLFEGFQSGGMPGGQLMITTVVENYPGFPKGIGGQELMAAMRLQALEYGTRINTEDVESVDFSRKPFSVTVGSGTYDAYSIIVATGATARRLPLDSEQRLWNKGISACAVCDGGLPIFRNKELAVIGGGDSAIEEALHLTQFASKVYLIHRRDQLRASQILQTRAQHHPKMEILYNKVVEEFLGETVLSGIRLLDTVTNTATTIAIAGAFEAIGHVPNTSFLSNQLKIDSLGYIVTTPGATTTSVDGIFAAGDVQDGKYRQAIAAAGSGCMAALEAEHWLSTHAHI